MEKVLTEQAERQLDVFIALIGWNGYLFMNRVKLTNELFFYKRINASLPNFLNEHLVIHNTKHNRSTRYARYNCICPNYKRETEGSRSFAVSATRLWNNVPLSTRRLDSVNSLKVIYLKQSSQRSNIYRTYSKSPYWDTFHQWIEFP